MGQKDADSSEYDLVNSTKVVGQLYPVLLASDGSVIDGLHRLVADKNWKAIRLPHIKTNAQKLVARIVANTCRRDITPKEKRQWVTELAEELKQNDVPRGKVAGRVAELTGMSDSWVRLYLPKQFKNTRLGANPRARGGTISEVKDRFQMTLDYVRQLSKESPSTMDRVPAIVDEELKLLEKRLAVARKAGGIKEDEKILSDIDTGYIFTCPICKKQLRIIHCEPHGSHKFQEEVR